MSDCPICRTPPDQWVYVSEIRRFQPPCGHPCTDHAKSLGATQACQLTDLLAHPPSPFWHSHERIAFILPGQKESLAWKRKLVDRPSTCQTHCSLRHPDEPGKWMVFEPIKDYSPPEPAECSICELKDQLLLLPCGHWACETCMTHEALAQTMSASSWLASGRLRCPYCRSHFSLELLDPSSFSLRCIRLVFSSVRLRWECKLKILILMMEAEAERLRQLVELVILLRSPPTRATTRKLAQYHQRRPQGQTQLCFSWNRVSRTFYCSLS